MVRLIRTLALLATVVALGLFGYTRFLSKKPYHKTPYSQLKRLLVEFESTHEKLKQRLPNEKDYVEHRIQLGYLKRDIRQLNEEIKIRQTHQATMLAAGGLLLLNLVQALLAWMWGRRTRRAGRKPGQASYHNGRIITEPSRIENVHPDDVTKKIRSGYETAKAAENWLRTDPFLFCSNCEVPVADEAIGRIQEVTFYQEHDPSLPKEAPKKIATVWLARPVDRFTCHKCGKILIRSIRT